MKSERRKFRMLLIFAVVFTTPIFVSLGCASGTPPEEAWNKTFGGTGFDGASSVQQTSDGGYILAGPTRSYGAGGGDFWLVKTDSEGNKQWDKTFGGTGYDFAHAVQQTTDGGYILAGGSSYGAGGVDVWLVKTDSEGNKQWDKTFGGTGYDSARAVQQTTDGGYILAGYTKSYGAGGEDFWLVKTDSEGTKQWDKTFGGTGYDSAHAAQQTSDGGYIFAGYTMPYGTGAGGYGFWLVKTDSEGNKQWDKTFGGTYNSNRAYSAQQTADGGYILAGYTTSYGAGSCYFWLVKTDSEGSKEWDRAFGKTGHDTAYSAKQTSDGGYILAGVIGLYSDGDCDSWLVKTDSEGNKQWDKTFGGTNWDRARSVQQTADGGYILAGYTTSYGAGEDDFWLIKVGNTSAPTETITSTADICVESSPSGVDVYLDDVYQGMTGPDYFYIYDVSPGYRTLTLEKYGYDNYTKTIFISTGDMASVSVVSASLSAIPTPTPREKPLPKQKNKTTQTIELVGGIIFLAATALLAGMLVGKFHKKRREKPKRDKREHETHKKSSRSTKYDTRPYYYKVLDVSTDASIDEIKKAYRRLSMLYHPDTSTDPDAEKKMKEINKAYDLLSDPDKRARYDNFENTFKG